MYTIHDLTRISKLSRSTLLYYDSLGLLKPEKRSSSNYRFYSEESLTVLNRICLYREAGVSLSDIGTLLEMPQNDDINKDILEKTLYLLNNQAREIQDKQKTIVEMLKAGSRSTDDEAAEEQYHVNLEKRMAAYSFNVHADSEA